MMSFVEDISALASRVSAARCTGSTRVRRAQQPPALEHPISLPSRSSVCIAWGRWGAVCFRAYPRSSNRCRESIGSARWHSTIRTCSWPRSVATADRLRSSARALEVGLGLERRALLALGEVRCTAAPWPARPDVLRRRRPLRERGLEIVSSSCARPATRCGGRAAEEAAARRPPRACRSSGRPACPRWRRRPPLRPQSRPARTRARPRRATRWRGGAAVRGSGDRAGAGGGLPKLASAMMTRAKGGVLRLGPVSQLDTERAPSFGGRTRYQPRSSPMVASRAARHRALRIRMTDGHHPRTRGARRDEMAARRTTMWTTYASARCSPRLPRSRLATRGCALAPRPARVRRDRCAGHADRSASRARATSSARASRPARAAELAVRARRRRRRAGPPGARRRRAARRRAARRAGARRRRRRRDAAYARLVRGAPDSSRAVRDARAAVCDRAAARCWTTARDRDVRLRARVASVRARPRARAG